MQFESILRAPFLFLGPLSRFKVAPASAFARATLCVAILPAHPRRTNIDFTAIAHSEAIHRAQSLRRAQSDTHNRLQHGEFPKFPKRLRQSDL